MNQNTLPGGLIVVILGLATYAVVLAPETTRGWPEAATMSATAQAPRAAPPDAAADSPSPIAADAAPGASPQRMVGLYVRCNRGTHVGRVVDLVRRLDDLILELRDSAGTTIILVTHELPSVLELGDAAVFLDAEQKTMIASGTPAELRDSSVAKVRAFMNRERL